MNKRFSYLLLGFLIILSLISFMNSSFFAIKDLEVVSSGLVPPDAYIPQDKLLGSNIFHIDRGNLIEKAYEHPQIRSVDIRRSLPGTIVYLVEERKPLAFIKAEHYYLVDREAYIIKRTENLERLSVPVVQMGEDFSVDPGGAIKCKEINEILHLLDLLGQSVLQGLVQVNLKNGDIVIHTEHDGLIYLGDLYSPEELAKILRTFFSEAEQEGWQLEYLDLRYEGRPVYRIKNE